MGDHRALFHFSVSGSCKRAFHQAKRFAAGLLADECGQGTLEYILILSATVVGAGAISKQVIRALDSGVLKLGGQLEKDLKSGRADLRVWSN
jgi:hypothetical protein